MPRTLAVVIHGWHSNPGKMADVIRCLTERYGTDVEICAPDLPHSRFLSFVRATDIVKTILASVDARLAELGGKSQIARIVFIGHSMGATLVRRVFLAAAGNPDNFQPEEGLAAEPPRDWAPLVERLILLAAFNRGWKISDRMSWLYAIGFNLVGLFGHIMPGQLSPTIFDLRLGAPFMVQTRLHWMAYRRARRAELQKGMDVHRPILVQIIGTRDDLISPVDQVDIAVDGTGRALVAGPSTSAERTGGERDDDRDYFLLETRDTDHDNAIKLFGDKASEARRDVLVLAFEGSRSQLDKTAIDPDWLTDQVDLVDRTVKEVVFVIHGIRDDGFWTHRVAEAIKRHAKEIDGKRVVRSWAPTYGYFAMLPFMLPWVRREKVEWFMDQYVMAFAQYPDADFHYVGHSNGTYLAARSFMDYPAFHLRRVLFAGSVVRTDFDWNGLLAERRIERFQNIAASCDWVVAWLPKSVDYWRKLDLGAGGFDGFEHAGQRPEIAELRFVRGGHGEGISEKHWPQIARFVTGGEQVASDNSESYAKRQSRWIAAIGSLRLVVPVLILVFAAIIPFFCFFSAGHAAFEGNATRLLVFVVYLILLRFVVLRL